MVAAVLVLAVSPAVSAPHPFQLSPVPRFMDRTDRSLLIFQQTVGPWPQEAVSILVESDWLTGRRHVRVDRRHAPDPSIDVVCDGAPWKVPLTQTMERFPSRAGLYVVPEAAATAWLSAATCVLRGVGREITIPIDLLRVAWRPPQRTADAPLLADVVSAFDSSIITVRIDGRLEAVRYIGVDAPTLYPASGPTAAAGEAARVNQELLRIRAVRLELDEQQRDAGGRLLVYVYAGDTMVNAELIRRGLARADVVPPNDRYADLFVALEREARDNAHGLWSPSAVPGPASPVSGRPGVEPVSRWTCPLSHPVKGRAVVEDAMRCRSTDPADAAYLRTRPDRCYVDVREATGDGCSP
jgi:micrococcal nuclease